MPVWAVLAAAYQGPDLPAGLKAQVDPQEVEVQRLDTGTDDLTVGLQIGGHLVLPVGIGASVDSLKSLLQLGHHIGIQMHQVAQGLTDYGIEREENDQREQGPEAAAKHADAFLFVELVDFLLISLLIVTAGDLDLLDDGLKTGGLHHALLTLGAHGEQKDLYRQREEDQGCAVVIKQAVKELQHIAKGNFDKFHTSFLLMV